MKRILKAAIVAATLAHVATAAEPPKMKMTTEVPEGVATPDKLETQLGTLTSFDGVPDDATTLCLGCLSAEGLITCIPITSGRGRQLSRPR